MCVRYVFVERGGLWHMVVDVVTHSCSHLCSGYPPQNTHTPATLSMKWKPNEWENANQYPGLRYNYTNNNFSANSFTLASRLTEVCMCVCVLVGWEQSTWTNTHHVCSVGGSVTEWGQLLRDSRRTHKGTETFVRRIQMRFYKCKGGR